MANTPKPVTADEIWWEMTDAERARLGEFYVSLDDGVYLKDDLHACADCGTHLLNLVEGHDGELRCHTCDADDPSADWRGLDAWATAVRGV